MNINLKVRYIAKIIVHHRYTSAFLKDMEESVEKSINLCFRHALEVASRGKNIETEVDDFSSDYDSRYTLCQSTKCGGDTDLNNKDITIL